MTTLLAIPKSLGHCIWFRTFLVFVYDILLGFWSSFMTRFMTTLGAIENNLGHCISFITFLVVVYDILGNFLSSFMTILVVIQNN